MSDAVVKPTDKRFQDLTGVVFGRLTVVEYAGQSKFSSMWVCRCSCGSAPKTIAGCDLKRRTTQSCGCMIRETTSKRSKTHGRTHTPEYRVWRGMINRCTNPSLKMYINYGGRGIAVCERWRYSFENFLADVGPRPTAAHSIDRYPNNDGNYEPGNCRWATAKQQGRNKRTSHLVTLDNQTLTLVEWVEKYNITINGLRSRMRAGWDFREALTTPLRVTKPYRKRKSKATLAQT